jgi:hypothetical protein
MTRDCLILGSGRSGTSFAAGMVASAGYFMGEQLWPANVGNPLGYFEDYEINSINEDLLEPLTAARGIRKFIRRKAYPVHKFQRWLAPIATGTSMSCSSGLAERIKAVTARSPFCFKDPRFCYTLPLWRPYLGNAALICLFRHPGVTANSILTECRRAAYLKHLKMDFRRALAVWEMMYRHILQVSYPAGGDWLFVHYDQLLDGTAAGKIESLLQIKVDTAFGDPNLKRSASTEMRPEQRQLTDLYDRLCQLAGFKSRSN